MSDGIDLDLVTLSGRLARREVSASVVTKAYLDRIERINPTLNAFRYVAADQASAQAKSSDCRWQVGVKDNINVAGLVTRSGLGLRDERPAVRDADVVARLRSAGAVILGHTNMHEGALGATTDNPHYGRTHNPWRLGYTPGGSSGGSAVAVAAGLCPVALGTDTMGSVRLPAAYCGIVGYKPSHGRISNAGIEPLCARLDQVGPMARSVADLRLFVEAMMGPLTPSDGIDLEKLRFGRLVEFDEVLLSDDVRRAFENALHRLLSAGVKPREVSIEGFQPDKARRVGLLLAEAEAADHFAKDRERYPQAFSSEFGALLDYGERAERGRLDEAERSIDLVATGFDALFEDIDLLLAPTAPQTAFSFDDQAPSSQADLTALANMAGAPAISMPIPSANLPVGLQLMGRRGADTLVLSVADLFERDLGFTCPMPELEEIP